MSDTTPESHNPRPEDNDDEVVDEVLADPVPASGHVNSARWSGSDALAADTYAAPSEPVESHAPAAPAHDESIGHGDLGAEPVPSESDVATPIADDGDLATPVVADGSDVATPIADDGDLVAPAAESDHYDTATYAPYAEQQTATEAARSDEVSIDAEPAAAEQAHAETGSSEVPAETSVYAPPAEATAYTSPAETTALTTPTETSGFGAAPEHYATAPTEAYGAPVVDTPPPPAVPIYVAAPTPPKRRGNRLFALLPVLLATILFAILFAGAIAVIELIRDPTFNVVTSYPQYVGDPSYYFPIIFFFVGAYVLAIILNRGSWWLWTFFGFFVGVLVYFSFIGGALISNHVWSLSARDMKALYAVLWLNPYAIAAGIIGREVTVWAGAWLAARGRKLKERNAEARAQFDRDVEQGPHTGQIPPHTTGSYAPAP